MASDMKDIWRRIVASLAKVVPEDELVLEFLPGATEAEVAEAESRMGLRLPDDVRESYKVHNGMGDLGAFYENQRLNVLDEVVSAWHLMCNLVEAFEEFTPEPPPGPVKRVWANSKWVPLTESGGGQQVCIDLDPPEGGMLGQAIEFCHETGPIRVLAASWRDFLSQFADDLEAGKYRYTFGGNISTEQE
jgi:cell wall assembly regulator SMI1